MTLSILEERLKENIPEENHDKIEKEFSLFHSEIQRISSQHDKIGQATLSNREKIKAPTANQHSENGFTIIELQCIKAAAIKYGVNDWVHRIDSSITYEENIHKFKEEGENRTMKEIEHLR